MIAFESQKEAVSRLQRFAEMNKHSLVIEGFKGRWDVDTKKLLYARLDIPKSAQEDYYLVLSYLSVLETGNQEDIDKWEKNGFVWKNIKDIDSPR